MTGCQSVRFCNKPDLYSVDYQTVADKKKEKSEIFPFLEWENLFLFMFCATADYKTDEKLRTITLILTWSALTNIRTYKAKTHSHVRVKMKFFMVIGFVAFTLFSRLML